MLTVCLTQRNNCFKRGIVSGPIKLGNIATVILGPGKMNTDSKRGKKMGKWKKTNILIFWVCFITCLWTGFMRQVLLLMALMGLMW